MNNSTLSIDFPSDGKKPITASFDGGDVTSDAGLLLIGSADRKIGLCRAMAEAVSDGRDPERVIIKCEVTQEKLNPRFVVTDLSDAPKELYEFHYACANAFGNPSAASAESGRPSGGEHSSGMVSPCEQFPIPAGLGAGRSPIAQRLTEPSPATHPPLSSDALSLRRERLSVSGSLSLRYVWQTRFRRSTAWLALAQALRRPSRHGQCIIKTPKRHPKLGLKTQLAAS